MTRYIDADELLARLKSDALWKLIARYNIEGVIEASPTADVVPVRHGKWIVRDNPGTGWYRITCSECGEDVTSTAPCIGFFPTVSVTWNYCPDCGAKMDAERKEE